MLFDRLFPCHYGTLAHDLLLKTLVGACRYSSANAVMEEVHSLCLYMPAPGSSAVALRIAGTAWLAVVAFKRLQASHEGSCKWRSRMPFNLQHAWVPCEFNVSIRGTPLCLARSECVVQLCQGAFVQQQLFMIMMATWRFAPPALWLGCASHHLF